MKEQVSPIQDIGKRIRVYQILRAQLLVLFSTWLPVTA